MAEKKVLMTYEGIKELEDELATLKGKTRMEVSDRLKSAISFGDITENSEYDEAKNEQAQVEARIMFLENLLMNVEVIDSDNIDTTNVTVGCRVKILDLEYDEEETFVVMVTRVSYSTKAIEVKAKDRKTAEELANAEAVNQVFKEDDYEYKTGGVYTKAQFINFG
mgnify:CR=1 FL=1